MLQLRGKGLLWLNIFPKLILMCLLKAVVTLRSKITDCMQTLDKETGKIYIREIKEAPEVNYKFALKCSCQSTLIIPGG